MYAQNDENYALAIYEGLDKKGNVKRAFESINNIDAGNYYKLSFNKNDNYLVPDKYFGTELPLKYLLKKGDMVLFYKKNVEEVFELSQVDLNKRLYKLAKFDAQGRLTFRYHKEARQASDLKEIYNVDFEKPFEQIRLQVSKLDILLENKDFKLSSSGKIIFK